MIVNNYDESHVLQVHYIFKLYLHLLIKTENISNKVVFVT